MPSRRHSRQTGPWTRPMAPPYTRRLLGGRHPSWGIGVTSLMRLTSSPAACSDRIAASRPAPGPLTYTSTWRTPFSMALRAALSAASPAAKGVPLRDPLNPAVPALAQARTLPWGSVMVTIVLLNVDWMWAIPAGTFLRSRRFPRAIPYLRLTTATVPPSTGAPSRRSSGALPRPGVGPGPLAPHGKAPPVAEAPVAPDLDQPPDVHGHLPPEVAFHLVVLVDDLAQPGDLLLGQVPDPGVGVDPGDLEDLPCPAAPDPVDVGEGHLHPLVPGKIDPCDASHTALPAPSLASACASGCRRSP